MTPRNPRGLPPAPPNNRPAATRTPRRRVALTAVVAAAIWSGTVQAAELRLRPECRCRGPVVTLGDLADVSAADAEQADRLKAIELFPALPPGTKRYLRLREIQDLLLIRGVNLLRHRLSGASQVVLLGVREEAETAGSSEGPKRSGVKTPVAPPESVVVVAANSLPRGAVIRAVDVRLEQGQGIGEASDALGAIDEVVGHQTTRAIPAGTILDRRSVRPPLLVRRGEAITVYARSAGIQVRTTAKAREEGSLGDLIEVESLIDRSAYLARVCGVQEAEVYARATRADQAAVSDSIRTRR